MTKVRTAADGPRKEVDAERFRLEQDLQWVLQDPRGRRTLQRILARAGIGRSIPHGMDVERALGRREVGLALVGHIKAIDPNYLVAMEAELAMPAEEPGQRRPRPHGEPVR